MRNLISAYSTRTIKRCSEHIIQTSVDGTPVDLQPVNTQLSHLEINGQTKFQKTNPVSIWYDQIGGHHLAPSAVQKAPKLSTYNHQNTTASRPGIMFTSVSGLTATHDIDYDNVAISLVMNYNEISHGSTVFNTTNSGGNRFSAHIPWSDGNVYFDSSDLNADDWRVARHLPIEGNETFLVTFVRSKEGKTIFINGTLLATIPATAPSQAIKGQFVLGTNNSVSSGFSGTIYELIIAPATEAMKVMSNQLKYFKLAQSSN